MSAGTRTIKAHCLCGKAAYDLIVPKSDFPLWSMWCHCNSCRHKTGTLCLSIVNPPHGWMPPKELLDETTAYQFSERLKMYFCSTCGCSMMTDCARSVLSDKGQHWDLHTGTFDNIDGVIDLAGHEYVADTLDGGFSDFLPNLNGKDLQRWPHRSSQGDQLPLYWTSPDKPTITPDVDDKLYCHCHCKGVEFYLSRPSERSKEAASGWADLIIPFHSTEPRPEPSHWWLCDNGRKFLAGNCSCNSCRLDTGSEYQSWCFIPTIDISLDREGKQAYKVPFGTLKAYQSSENVTRYHCATCGSSVFFTGAGRTDLVDVAVGVLDAPEGARADSWLEWRMNRVSFREDTVGRADGLVEALEEGQQAWAERRNK